MAPPRTGLEAAIELPSHARAPSLARRRLTSLLTVWQLTDKADHAQLMLSELVSNAVRHAGAFGASRLLLKTTEPNALYVAVIDRCPLPPILRQVDEHSEGGRGG
ncbi:ATP-binding protein [Flindersiella endophytica]